MRGELRVAFGRDEVAEEEHVVVTRVDRAPQQGVDGGIEMRIAVVGRAALRHQPLPARAAHLVLDVAHQRVDVGH